MSVSARIGVFGGTFDPVHWGHLEAAEVARRALELDEVLLMPARLAPHRPTPPRASGYHRFAMIALATMRYPRLRGSDLELSAPEPSYTSLTLQRLARAGFAPGQLFFIAGADAFAEIATWYDYPGLLDRGHFIVITRPGHPVAALRDQLPALAPRMRAAASPVSVPAAPPLGIFLVDAATPAISSTLIRERVARGEPVSALVPPEVESYIERHGLYRSRPQPTESGHESS